MKTVCFDIDTQFDFALPSGALSVPGGERILPAVEKLNRWAARNGVPVISSMDAHTECDREFQIWPAHCVAGTLGQRKLDATLLERRLALPSHTVEFDLNGVQQVLVEKQTLNCFDNANLRPLLERLDAERYVVYGLVTEYCVWLAAQGLLQTGRPVAIVTDAVETLKSEDSARVLSEFTAAGGELIRAAQVAG